MHDSVVWQLLKNRERLSSAVPALDCDWLDRCMDAAIGSVMPSSALMRFALGREGLRLKERLAEKAGRLLVFGAGKASAEFSRAFSGCMVPDIPSMLIGPEEVSDGPLTVLRGAHPLPDAATLRNTNRVVAEAQASWDDATVVFLLSGGASSMFSSPEAPAGLEEARNITSALLSAGVPISDLNCVRRHISCVKGGRFAASLHPREVITLSISDVPTGRPYDIGSGPTVADPTTCLDAADILERAGASTAAGSGVMRALLQGKLESVKEGDPRLSGIMHRSIACNRDAVEHFAAASMSQGVATVISGRTISGGPEDAASSLVSEGRGALRGNGVLVAGGEITVRAPGNSPGGRCQHFAMHASSLLREGELVIAFGTDGRDGNSMFAGAVGSPNFEGADEFLDRFESGRYAESAGACIETGPTGTNVADIYAYIRTGMS